MFELVKRMQVATRPTPAAYPCRMVFPDGAAAFKYACDFMDCSISVEAILPALVLDMHELGGSSDVAVKISPEGKQLAMIRIAAADGGFVVMTEAQGPAGPRLKPGDLVAWRVETFSPAVSQAMKDPRSGWIGVIVGTLKPEHENGTWVGGERFG